MLAGAQPEPAGSRAMSRSGGGAADLRPDLKGTGPGVSMLGSGEVIATEMEQVVDRVVSRQEPLRLTG